VKIFDKLFKLSDKVDEKLSKESTEIKKTRYYIEENIKIFNELVSKKNILENETIPILVREHQFVDKNYFLPDIDFLRHLSNAYIYFVTSMSDNSEYGKLRQKLQNIQYDIYCIRKKIDYMEDKIERYNNMLPKFIRRDKLEKLNKRYYKFKDGKKTKYTKYEIKRKILR